MDNFIDIVLDYIPKFDKKSKNFPLVSLLEIDPKEKRTVWKSGPIINQGKEGACVGFAWTNYLLGSPNKPSPNATVQTGNEFALNLYSKIRDNDFMDGEDYKGTSVLAGAFVAQDLGYIEKYYWCFSVEDVKKAVLAIGPVVVGTKWFKSMYKTREDGLVEIIKNNKPSHHAYVIIGYDPAMELSDGTHEVFIIKNSWGPTYGNVGEGYIKVSDFAILASMAEMCVPVGKNPPVFNKYGILEDKALQPKENPNVIRQALIQVVAKTALWVKNKLGL